MVSRNRLGSNLGCIPRIDSGSAASLTKLRHLVVMDVEFESGWTRDGTIWDVLCVKIRIHGSNKGDVAGWCSG